MMEAGRVHFVGIGGSGMSAIAVALLQTGASVSGSDLKDSRNTHQLAGMGAVINVGHRAENVEGAALVVVSTAVPGRNPEVRRAAELGIEVISRGMMLARLMGGKRGIAIAGTHGKTTTTSMVAMILKAAGLDPTYLVGAELNDVGSNAESGSGEFLVAEADESDGSFLLLRPEMAIVTNVEPDHMDFYEDFWQIEDSFAKFLSGIQPGGVAVINGDDGVLKALGGQLAAKVVTYGGGAYNTYRWGERRLAKGGSEYEVIESDESLGWVRLHVPGEHNISNSLGALALARQMDITFEVIAGALEGFRGVRRRFEHVGTEGGITLIDDYAHHPTEVAATLKTARVESEGRLVCMFQPHRYSRTSHFSGNFGVAFKDADFLILTDVFAAGERPLPGVSGKLLVDAVLEEEPGKSVVYLPKRAEVGTLAARLLRPGDMVLVMGAGDISQCATEIRDLLRTEANGGERVEECVAT